MTRHENRNTIPCYSYLSCAVSYSCKHSYACIYQTILVERESKFLRPLKDGLRDYYTYKATAIVSCDQKFVNGCLNSYRSCPLLKLLLKHCAGPGRGEGGKGEHLPPLGFVPSPTSLSDLSKLSYVLIVVCDNYYSTEVIKA